MTVLIIENAPPSLRGDVSRWMVEIKAGVFVGKVSKLVRDRVWERCVTLIEEGSLLLIWKTNSEQGFDLRSWNTGFREPVLIDGLWLVRTKSADKSADNVEH